MGLFAHLLHMTPRDVDECKVGDFLALCHWIDRYEAEATKGGD